MRCVIRQWTIEVEGEDSGAVAARIAEAIGAQPFNHQPDTAGLLSPADPSTEDTREPDSIPEQVAEPAPVRRTRKKKAARASGVPPSGCSPENALDSMRSIGDPASAYKIARAMGYTTSNGSVTKLLNELVDSGHAEVSEGPRGKLYTTV